MDCPRRGQEQATLESVRAYRRVRPRRRGLGAYGEIVQCPPHPARPNKWMSRPLRLPADPHEYSIYVVHLYK